MQNERPLDDPRLEEARRKIMAVYEEYGIAGVACVIGPEEWGFAYQVHAPWSACQFDPTTPLLFRIRAKTAEVGHERVHQLLEAAAHTFCALGDFGAMTSKWAGDLIRILQRQGIEIEHTSFGGGPIGEISEYPPRRR